MVQPKFSLKINRMVNYMANLCTEKLGIKICLLHTPVCLIIQPLGPCGEARNSNLVIISAMSNLDLLAQDVQKMQRLMCHLLP